MNLKTLFSGKTIQSILDTAGFHGYCWLLKRLSGNDTSLTGGHQCGIYIPKEFVKIAFPEINNTKIENPSINVDCYFPLDDYYINDLRVIYYNNRYTKPRGTRNEFRITRWGGTRSPNQKPENTGALFFLAVEPIEKKCVAIVTGSDEEEKVIENWFGREIEPGNIILSNGDYAGLNQPVPQDIPVEWYSVFPSGKEIFEYIRKKLPLDIRKSPDDILLMRRELEFRVFELIEKNDVFPLIQKGFTSIEAFIATANSVANRRKSRSGTSLELNLESIFSESGLFFETQVITENHKKPDFIFPSGKAYHDKAFPVAGLFMLGSKTSIKERWRQIISEADRIPYKHLFTLQQGVSTYQLEEMISSGITLVVPLKHMISFPEEKRKTIKTLGGFINEVRAKQNSMPEIVRWIN